MQHVLTSTSGPTRRTSYLWIIVVGFAWPAIQIAIYVARSGKWPPEFLVNSLYFLPMGLLSSAVLVLLLRRATHRPRRLMTITGYLLATPIAYVSGVLSGLLLPPLVGITLYGTPLLLVGTLLGYACGAVWDARSQAADVGWSWAVASLLGLVAAMALGVMGSIKLSAAVAYFLIRAGILPTP